MKPNYTIGASQIERLLRPEKGELKTIAYRDVLLPACPITEV